MDAEPMSDKLEWGCLFCNTGAEEQTAQALLRDERILQAFCVRQLQHRSQNGQKSEIIRVMMPGYVFFRAKANANIYAFQRRCEVLRVLSYSDTWALRGDDLAFVERMSAHQGMLGMSKVFHEGDKVVIVSGPLKEFEAVVRKIDRHNRNGLVHITFGGKEIKVWLPFEYITEERA